MFASADHPASVGRTVAAVDARGGRAYARRRPLGAYGCNALLTLGARTGWVLRRMPDKQHCVPQGGAAGYTYRYGCVDVPTSFSATARMNLYLIWHACVVIFWDNRNRPTRATGAAVKGLWEPSRSRGRYAVNNAVAFVRRDPCHRFWKRLGRSRRILGWRPGGVDPPAHGDVGMIQGGSE